MSPPCRQVRNECKIGGPSSCFAASPIATRAPWDRTRSANAPKALLAIVDAGGDPARDQRNLRAAWTVTQAAEAYLGSAEFAKKTRKVRSGDTGTINNHIVHRLAGE
jgi:hypothetical protein